MRPGWDTGPVALTNDRALEEKTGNALSFVAIRFD